MDTVARSSSNITIGIIGTTLGILQHKYRKYYCGEMDLNKLIGRKIARARLDRGWKQDELARRCGIFDKEGEPFQARISHYETGRSPINAEIIQMFCEVFDLTPAGLMEYGEELVREAALSNAEAALIHEYRLLDDDGRLELLEEIEQIKRRMGRRKGSPAPGLSQGSPLDITTRVTDKDLYGNAAKAEEENNRLLDADNHVGKQRRAVKDRREPAEPGKE